MKALQIEKAVDKHLKPVKDSDGTLTALEVSTDTVKVGNLESSGTVTTSSIKSDGDMSLGAQSLTIESQSNSSPDLILKSNYDGSNLSNASLKFLADRDGEGTKAGEDGDDLGVIDFRGFNDASPPEDQPFARILGEIIDASASNSESGRLQIQLNSEGLGLFNGATFTGSDTTGEVNVSLGSTTSSVTTIAGDLDIDGDKITSNTNLTIDTGAGLILDSGNGRYLAYNAGTEFSAANSAYAGMILGYTVIGDNATPAGHDVLAAMTVVHDDLKVSFVFPPSGKVEILASIYVQTDSARPLTFGLSTTNATTGFTSLGAKYEQHTIQPDETDGIQHTHRWYITGTAGDSEELWFAAGCTHTNRYDLYWGGDSSSVADSSHPMEYQPFVMKATALPATIYTG